MSTSASPGPGSGTRIVSSVTGAFFARTTTACTLCTIKFASPADVTGVGNPRSHTIVGPHDRRCRLRPRTDRRRALGAEGPAHGGGLDIRSRGDVRARRRGGPRRLRGRDLAPGRRSVRGPIYDELVKRRRLEPIYSTAVATGRSLFGFWRLTRTATGLGNIPDSGGAVIAMTHFGYLEFALVEWAAWMHNRRRIRFMAQKGAFDKPVIGTLLRGMRHISVDMTAGASAYADAVAALRAGELIGVFPEAGVNSSFTVRELKTGAARLAAEAGVPIIPVAVWGGQRLLTKNHKVGFRERFGVPITYAVGEPIVVTADDDVTQATEDLKGTLQGLVDTLQADYPVDGTGQWWQPRHLGGTAPTPVEAGAADEARRLRREKARLEKAELEGR
ncbi:MAG: 1-acyl-sn-glycerol-3-phosphate acyltransferase [Burkholderiaceae bacterium]|nr:1-acyl-sn-glycerol-3-phosphate acyltransferase [Microbacteriaceae bacterium]